MFKALLIQLKYLLKFSNQLFLERERAAQLAESQTDELIKEAPAAQHDKSGEWQETSGEIQWVSTEKADNEEKNKKEEDDEELDLNKGIPVHLGGLGKGKQYCDYKIVYVLTLWPEIALAWCPPKSDFFF